MDGQPQTSTFRLQHVYRYSNSDAGAQAEVSDHLPNTVSLSNRKPRRPPVLDQRFAVLKQSLVKPEHKQKVIESYARLQRALAAEVDLISKNGPAMVPEIDFNDVMQNSPPAPFLFSSPLPCPTPSPPLLSPPIPSPHPPPAH